MKKTWMLFALLVAGIFSIHAMENIKVGSSTRQMISYAPAGLPKSPALVICCHGMNQDPAYQQGMSHWEDVADTAKFVVVYPQGEGNSWELWGDKDIRFMETIIDSMASRYNVNRNRVYLTGFSMGGMFTYYAASRIADKIAAFAPTSGYLMSGPNATASRPVPIFHTHGTSDDVCVYSSVQSHIDAWVKFNGCNTVPEVIKPRCTPNSAAELRRYRGGKQGVEVDHLMLPGKGHWWSNDPSQAMTSCEVWNFFRGYNLQGTPEVVDLIPENNSFDLNQSEMRSFTVTFSQAVDCSQIKAFLKSATNQRTTLKVESEGFQKLVAFSLPETANLTDGEYTLTISKAVSEYDATMGDLIFNYTFGVTEVGEAPAVETLFSANWSPLQETIGEGIPLGWRRVNETLGGTKLTINGDSADCTGSRLKYFSTGGDFDTGFLLTAGGDQSSALYYGYTVGHRLALAKGKYTIRFQSIYWNSTSKNNNTTFNFTLLNGNGTSVFSAGGLLSAGNMGGYTGKKVSGSKSHSYDVEITKKGNYLFSFDIASGKNAVVIGDIIITTKASSADTYKGTLYRLLLSGRKLLAQYESSAEWEVLRGVLDEYDTFHSTSPSSYTAAITVVTAAINTYDNVPDKVPVGVASILSEKSPTATYDLSGKKVNKTSRGIYIRNGKKVIIR